MSTQEKGDAVISVRPAVEDDLEFLFDLYGSTRSEEMASWGWGEEQKQSFLKMQFDAQRWSYRAQFPNARHDIILYNNQPVGRFMVDRGAEDIRLVDVALLPDYRGKGIGGELISAVIDEGGRSRRAVSLEVLKDNIRAKRLYERLGFVVTEDTGIYYSMECKNNGFG